MACTPNMGHTFDKMAKALATGISRRDAFKYVGAGVLGSMLVSVGVRQAEAATCSGAVCGACAPAACGSPTSGQCFCTFKVKNGACLTSKPAKCVTNFFCPGTACNSTAECRAQFGRVWKCIDSACCGTLGVCAGLCGKVPGCCSTQGGASAMGA